MLPSFCTQTITRMRASKRESRGKLVDDWDAFESVDIDGCSVQPASSSMTLDLRIAKEASMIAYVPSDADIDAGDRVTHLGITYTVLGRPMAWPSPTGGMSHKIASLKEWRG